ncbi:MAG: PAS domain S-box protein, partial [Pseudomonadota bacterium]
MNLKNRFRLIIFSMVALLVSIAVIVTIGIRYTKVHIQQAIGMDELVVDLYELQILSSEYVATPSERVKQQWRTKYDRIRSKLIEHRSMPDDVKDELNGLQQLFDRLTSLPDAVPGMEASQKRLRNQIAATLTLESQRIIEWASSLSIQKKDGIVPYLLLIDAVMLAVILVAVLVVITIMIISTRYILLSIKRLKEGAEEIASGKLGFQVEQAGNDEIAMLATAINQMSIDLKDSYANLYEKTVQLETEIAERQMIQESLNIKTVELKEEIEERKRTEEALRRSEENLNKAQKLSHIGSYMYDVANDRFEWSDEVFRIIGIPSQQEFTGSTNDYFKSIHPDDRERVVQSIEDAIVEKSEEDFIHRIIRPDGEERFIHERFRPIFDESGRHIKNIGSIQDITERKRTEEALKESEAKYRSMMEAMDDAVYICSGNFRIEYMNTAMIKRIGYDATGEPCYKVMHGFDEKCPWCIYDKVMKGQFIKTEVVSPKDNRAYHVSNSPIFHSNGAVSKLTIFRDITEIKKTEERLLQAQKMEAIGSLAGGIAHDLNNILFPISGFSEMLLDEIPPDNHAHESIEQIYKSAKRGSDLVNQILAFSRQSNIQKLPIRIQPILKEVFKLVRATIPKNIELTSHIEK